MNTEIERKIKKYCLLITVGITLLFIFMAGASVEKSFKESTYYYLNCQPPTSAAIANKRCELSSGAYITPLLVGGVEGIIVGLIYAYIFSKSKKWSLLGHSGGFQIYSKALYIASALMLYYLPNAYVGIVLTITTLVSLVVAIIYDASMKKKYNVILKTRGVKNNRKAKVKKKQKITNADDDEYL